MFKSKFNFKNDKNTYLILDPFHITDANLREQSDFQDYMNISKDVVSVIMTEILSYKTVTSENNYLNT